MDSGRSLRRRKAAAPAEAWWADLPPELLTTISGRHQHTSEIVRFRSVCRSWRSSTALPPNKLSPFFPLTLSDQDITISATAVYLLRPRTDPSKPFLVSAQEPLAGSLVLRHALSYKKIESLNRRLLNPDSFEIQTVARSYTCHGNRCVSCNQIIETGKAAFIYESINSSIGLCSYQGHALSIRVDLKNAGKPITVTPLRGHCHQLRDYVCFNGRIFALDESNVIFLFDPTDSRLNRVGQVTDAFSKSSFVVSDGDLYLVSRCYTEDPCTCVIYRLVEVKATDGNRCSMEAELERVEDLGDRVFVIGMDCAFSISARNLPDPWEGNCVVFVKVRPSMCGCYRDFEYKGDEIFRVFGGHKWMQCMISSLQSYSDLFCPHASAPLSKRRRLKA